MITRSAFISFSFLVIIGLSGAVGLWSIFTQSIRLDEAQSIWVSTKPVPALLNLTSKDVHVPLYGVILHFWMQFFGNSIISARLLSFFFYVLTLPVLYRLSKDASNRKIALLSVMLFSISPFIVWYTSEARMYTLFTFVTSLNSLFFLRLLRSESKKGIAGYFFSLVLGFYTHYFFIFLVATQIVYLFIYSFFEMKKSHERNIYTYLSQFKKRYLFTPFLLMLGAFLCFLPWVLYVIGGGAASDTRPQIPPPTSYNIFQTFINFLFGFQQQGIQRILVSLWPLAVVLLFFVFTKRQRVIVSGIEYFVLATFLPILFVFLLSYVRPIFLSRYLILVTPTLFFIIAWIIMQYSRKVSTYIVSLLLISMLSLMLYQNVSSSTPVKENYEGTAEYLRENASPQDIIAVSAPFTIYPIEYSYGGNSRITTIPEWNRFDEGGIPPFNRENLEIQIKKYETQYAKLFLVLSYDQGYEDEINNFFDDYHQIDKKVFSEGLEIRVYKLRYDI